MHDSCMSLNQVAFAISDVYFKVVSPVSYFSPAFSWILSLSLSLAPSGCLPLVFFASFRFLMAHFRQKKLLLILSLYFWLMAHASTAFVAPHLAGDMSLFSLPIAIVSARCLIPDCHMPDARCCIDTRFQLPVVASVYFMHLDFHWNLLAFFSVL